MKLNINILACAAVLASGLTSCLEETFPTSSVTSGQLGSDIPGLSNGVSGYMTTYGSSDNSDVGMAANIIWRDASAGNIPIVEKGYDYFNWFGEQTYLGDYNLQTLWWRRYYYLIQKANAVLLSAGRDPESSDAPYIGDAFAYRAMAYMDLAFSYEYFKTNTSVDAKAQELGIYGLTVPIVTENTSESDARNNPRAPFHTMYRFINSDLTEAEKFLANTVNAASYDKANLGLAYGLHARLWLTIATRFRLHPEDLQTALSNENNDTEYPPLGVTSAQQAYAKAAEYARKAINLGYAPLSYSQWFDPKTGFNTPTQAWLLGIIINADNALTNLDWKSFVSFTCPEALWGVADMTSGSYNAARMIDAKLWEKVQPNDWRAMTWIAPEDAGSQSAFNSKYKDKLNTSYSNWKSWCKYVGTKYHPAGGETTNSKAGNAISIPLMRIEECYFIEAEAVAFSQGVPAGKQLLESFMNSYRMTGNTGYSAPSDEEGFLEELIAQKRIEFWLEGVTYFDIRRLELAIIKAYPGTNHPQAYQFNSNPNAVAPWTTLFIPVSECNLNTACKRNPDPSGAIPAGTIYDVIH